MWVTQYFGLAFLNDTLPVVIDRDMELRIKIEFVDDLIQVSSCIACVPFYHH